MPSNYLELALWLEADRMGFLLDALDQDGFDTERDVVKNERRQSYENRPYGMAQWHMQQSLFPLPHPYHWMTIGSQEDLDAASLDDVKDFFRQYYSPSNASLAIAGDIDTAEALDLAHRYFSDLNPGPSVRRIERADSLLSGRVDLEMTDRVTLPRILRGVAGSGELFGGRRRGRHSARHPVRRAEQPDVPHFGLRKADRSIRLGGLPRRRDRRSVPNGTDPGRGSHAG